MDHAATDDLRQLVILGSTGSIGTQAIDVIRRNPDRFQVTALAAGGHQPALLADQARALDVRTVAIADPRAIDAVRAALVAAGSTAELVAGPTAVADLAAGPCDAVLNGMTSSVGLAPTLAAVRAGRTVILANKESLVAGGPLIRAAARPGQLVPVDSEHSALAQCLRAGRADEVRRLVLTASGGPLRGWSREQVALATPEDVLAHPTWIMGPVVTVNSATLINKGLEVIEAHFLFDLPYDRIDVVVHPQSVVHSMVEFTDGSTIAQASPPDMRLPLALGLGWPDRVPDAIAPVDWSKPATWQFQPLDQSTFPAVALARHAGIAGGTAPAVYNAANEECVAEFLAGRLPFPAIVETVEQVLEAHEPTPLDTIDDVIDAENWARADARGRIADRIAFGSTR